MQIFPKKLNYLPVVVTVAALAGATGITFVFWYYFSPKNLQVGYAPEQPVPYSHRLHVGQLGMDCRYCHANVERSAHSMVPPTQTCMGCHSMIKTKSARLQNVRESWQKDEPIAWIRVHQIPDHAYFNHSVHVSAGVGCVSCHGRIDQMEVVRLSEPLGMGWCLNCHRNPEPNLRPVSEVTNMEWNREQAIAEGFDPHAAAAGLNPPEHCAACHH